jgi:hypothetical protein
MDYRLTILSILHKLVTHPIFENIINSYNPFNTGLYRKKYALRTLRRYVAWSYYCVNLNTL